MTGEAPGKAQGAGLLSWVIYDHPADFPDVFVARLFDGEDPTVEIMVCPDLETIRDELHRRGFIPFARVDEDPPAVVETWL